MDIFPRTPSDSSPFSEFIRNASSGEKKRVYNEVLKKANEAQAELVRKADLAKPTTKK